MKLATWNVNSLKVRLPHLLDWLGQHAPDVMCLQETKLEDAKFPASELAAAGYQALYSGQKTYNGVAILGRAAGADAVTLIPDFVDEQKRVLAASVDDVRVICLYVPNGQTVASEKYAYKLRWLAAVHSWLAAELQRHPRLIVAGDYNIAPEPQDVHDSATWEGQVLFSEPERAAFKSLQALGLVDCFRRFDQPERSYTWWDYRMNAFRRKMGLRIDHILASAQLAATCVGCTIDSEPRRLERPSDHAPVIAEFTTN